MVQQYNDNDEGPDEIKTIQEGYMFIQGSKVWKPWSMKARYFILTSECLYCFKRRGDLDAVPSDVIQLDGTSVTVDEEKRGMRKRYYIRLTSTSQRKSFNLFCFVVEERDTWLTSVLSALAKKYTDKCYSKKYHEPTCKAISLQNNRRETTITRKIEQTRAMSISCMELTNLSVVDEPMTPAQTVIPIRKKFEFSHHKKISSGSLDLAFRTDINPRPQSNSNVNNISMDTREHYATLNRTKKQTLKSSSDDRLKYKRVKSMTDLLERQEDMEEVFFTDSCHSTPSQKRKRKALSLGMFTNPLNFRTVSMANIF